MSSRLLEKKVDSLAKKMDTLAVMMTKVHQVALLGKAVVAQDFTPPETLTTSVDDEELTSC